MLGCTYHWGRGLESCRQALAVALLAIAVPLGAAPDTAKALQGDAQAQYDLAAAYFQGGQGFEKNIPLALQWLEKAAAQGHIEASYRLGEIYFNGYGDVPKDFAKAAAAFQKPAAAGYSEAKVYLGYQYFMGQGVAKDEARGIAFLREMSAKGNGPARKLLWEAYAGGKLKPADDAELIQFLEAGVAIGDPRAREALGVRLMLGQGVARDAARARPMLLDVAERGSVLAASTLAQDLGERLTDPAIPLSPRMRDTLDVQFKRMVHLVAVFGGVQGMETYVRVITRLTPLPVLAPKEADGSIVVGDDVVEALAWAQLYHERGGPDKAVLEWLVTGQAWINDYTRIRDRLAAKDRLLRAELARLVPEKK